MKSRFCLNFTNAESADFRFSLLTSTSASATSSATSLSSSLLPPPPSSPPSPSPSPSSQSAAPSSTSDASAQASRTNGTITNANLIFSVEFWQPFISLESNENNSTLICGPLLGYLIELSNKLHCNLTYVPDLNNEIEPYEIFKQKQIHLLLTPYAPMNFFEEDAKNLMHLSRIFGDIPTISILSAKRETTIDLNSLKPFNIAFIHFFLIFFSVIAFVVLSIGPVWYGNARSNLALWLIQAVLRQAIHRFDHRQRCRPIFVNLIWLTFFLQLFISNLLLSFYQFSTSFDTIDDLGQLIKHEAMQIFVFKGETGEKMLMNPNDIYYNRVKKRILVEGNQWHNCFRSIIQLIHSLNLSINIFLDCGIRSIVVIKDPSNEEIDDWQKLMAERIHDRKLAIISDKYYLDYFYNTYIELYPNLHRSLENELTLPYFLPLSNNNSYHLDSVINRL
ncbi:hypothetical protein QR98_0009720 [Sarcoptes scabiei]|uniref:Uncharacterized protein n=1 Tax=Sarcoptes scabiei TaxID=52283 RepID=A0A131ZV07_SARSC|nr:hypothetical protein QR98_0009720 [Sarcoptes scabiei]